MWQLSDLTSDDYEAAMALWKASPGVRANESREEFERILRRNPGLSSAARSEGALVGALFCCHDGRRGYLYHLAVAASHRGKGLGRALVTESLARLQAEGIRRCTIFLIADNHAGHEFWRRVGFFDRVELRAMAFDFECP